MTTDDEIWDDAVVASGMVAGLALRYANKHQSLLEKFFRPPDHFRDGYPTRKDARNFLLATFKVAAALMEAHDD